MDIKTAIETCKFGYRITAGEGEDRDYGRIVAIGGHEDDEVSAVGPDSQSPMNVDGMALVRWESNQRMWCPIADIYEA